MELEQQLSMFSVVKELACKEVNRMSVLSYIDELIEQGYSQEEAERCADYMFADEWESDED